MRLFLSGLATAVLLAGTHLAAQTDARATSACPSEDPRARAMAHRFLSSPSFAESRGRLGMEAASPAELRLLADGADADACAALAERVPLTPRKYPRVATYYRVGSHYLVIFTQVVPPGETYITWHPLIVLDDGFTFRDAFAM